MKTKRWLWLFTALSVLVICFIWGNSALTVEQSSAQSNAVANILKPGTDTSTSLKDFYFHLFLRKTAHAVEFIALGLCVGGATLCLGRLKGKRLVSLPLLVVLAVAVLDEYIQYFFGRGSSVTDVVLDFCSAFAGIALMVLWAFLWKKITKRG